MDVFDIIPQKRNFDFKGIGERHVNKSEMILAPFWKHGVVVEILGYLDVTAYFKDTGTEEQRQQGVEYDSRVVEGIALS